MRSVRPIRPIASEGLEAGATAMAQVPQHLLDSVEALYAEYCSAKAECLKLNASTELNAIIAIWEKKVQNLPQTLGNLDEIRHAAMKLDRKLQTAINNDLPDVSKRLTRLDRQSEALLLDLENYLNKLPSVIASMKKIAENRASSLRAGSVEERSKRHSAFTSSIVARTDRHIKKHRSKHQRGQYAQRQHRGKRKQG
jgi:hypothetical protein